MVEDFTIDVSDAQLADLKARLAAFRPTPDFDNENWKYGADASYIAELVQYWHDEYDWRAREKLMNSFSHFRTPIDGMPIHFIHEQGKGPNPVPLMINHGWPWSFWDMAKIIGPLSDPASHGGDPADAFDVVAPSLPGYAFSTPLERTGINFWNTADLWVKLMSKLGYERFASQGGDWGAFVTGQLGHKHAERMIGVHITTPIALDFMEFKGIDPDDFTPEEQGKLARIGEVTAEGMGYFFLQKTKPQTPAIALNDSPAGLLAWIVEKRRDWGDCEGDVESRFTKDELIDTAMIYWITQSYHTSARYYYEADHNPWQPVHDRMPVVEAPTALAIFPREITLPARKWAERYYNLQQWSEMKSGGHFAPMEEPEALVEDIRKFFRDKR